MQLVFGGYIRLDKSSNTHKWDLYREEAVLEFYKYLQEYPLYSHKKKRFSLLKRFYALKKCRAYIQDPDSLFYKAWIKLEKDWNTF